MSDSPFVTGSPFIAEATGRRFFRQACQFREFQFDDRPSGARVTITVDTSVPAGLPGRVSGLLAVADRGRGHVIATARQLPPSASADARAALLFARVRAASLQHGAEVAAS